MTYVPGQFIPYGLTIPDASPIETHANILRAKFTIFVPSYPPPPMYRFELLSRE